MKKRMLCLILAVCLLACLLPADVRAASSMKASDDVISIIKQFEGFSGTPYVDTDGLYTIGYGTRCPEELVAQYNETPMTEEEADAELRKTMAGYEKDVNAFMDKYGLSYEQRQFDAVISFVFNVGSGWLRKGETLVNALTSGASGNELIYAFTIYSMSGGSRSVGHIRRRLSEACIYLEGVYSRPAPDRYCYTLFDAQGGTISAMGGTYNVQGYNGELTAKVIPIASREGYVFGGWYTKTSGGSRVEVLDMSTKGKTLYAHWEKAGDTPSVDPAPTEPAPTVPAEPEGDAVDPVKVKVTGSQINVRKGPGLSYATVGTMNRGTQVTVDRVHRADGYTWGKCNKGWIALENTSYFNVEKPTEPKPTEPAPTEPKPTEPKPTEPKPTEPKPTEPPKPELTVPEGTVTDPVEVTVTGVWVNLRKGPGLGFDVIGTTTRGKKFTVSATYEADGYLWGKYDKGWLCLDHTDFEEVTKVPEEPEVPELPEEPTMPGPGESLYATVKDTPSLNVRKVPQGAVVSVLHKGDRVQILEQKIVDGVLWGRFERGWISMRTYVTLETVAEVLQEAPTEPTVPEEVPTEPEVPVRIWATVVGTSTVAVRDRIDGTVVGKLAPGSRVEILERTEDWGRCAQGWIRLHVGVKLEQEPSAQEQEAPVLASVVRTYAATREEVTVYDAPDGEEIMVLPADGRTELLEYRMVRGVLWARCDGGWIGLREGVDLETVVETTVPEDPLATFRPVVVQAACLNVRGGPGNERDVVCRLDTGDVVAVRELMPKGTAIWARTDLGWINMDNIS